VLIREIRCLERDEKGDSMLERRLNCLESVCWEEREIRFGEVRAGIGLGGVG
jgi:hypothetical protein